MGNNVELKIVDKHTDHEDLEKGEAIIYGRSNNSLGLIFACPNCGHVASGNHIYNEETKSMTPSIVCNKCGWHGFLTNGTFINS